MPNPHYRVAYIAGSRMPPGYDWIYAPGEQGPILLLRAGADERQAILEVVEMLAAQADADRAAYAQQVA